DRLLHVVAREQHLAEVAAHEADRLAGHRLPEPGLDALLAAALDLLVVLGEVARMGLVPPLHLAGVRRDVAAPDLEQRRLAAGVRPDDRQRVAAPPLERDVVEHPLVAVGLRPPLERQYPPAARPHLLERERRVAARALRQALDDD